MICTSLGGHDVVIVLNCSLGARDPWRQKVTLVMVQWLYPELFKAKVMRDGCEIRIDERQ